MARVLLPSKSLVGLFLTDSLAGINTASEQAFIPLSTFHESPPSPFIMLPRRSGVKFLAVHAGEITLQKTVGNQQKWHTLRPERSGIGLRSGELPEGPVVLSPPFDGLGPNHSRSVA